MESGSNFPTPGNYPSGDRQQVHGLSSQGHDNNQSESPTSINSSSVPTTPTTPVKQTSSTVKNDDTPSNDSTSFLDTSATIAPITPTTNATITATPTDPPTNNSSNFLNIEHTEALQHLEKALSSCEVTLTETPGMVKMEPDEQFFQQQDKPNSISMVPTSNSNTTTSSPFPATEGYQRQRRRPESELILASEMVARGETFQAAAEKYNIPISTIHFYM
ncbi:hypothetical protein PV326_004961, partial [Microctonus aethiopoides]